MKLEEHTLQSSSSSYVRQAWLLNDDKETNQKLCVFLDAEYYLHHLKAPEIIEGLRRQDVLPPVACVFVSHLNAEARHHDYTCNDQYSSFIATDLTQWAKERVSGIDLSESLIAGLSLSGLASAYLAFSYPRLFSRALCQSGSFWWNREWLVKNKGLRLDPRSRFWISVGDRETEADVSHPPTGLYQETSQLAASARMSKRLREAGIAVSDNPFSGGHEIEPWRKELPSALTWLMRQEQRQR